MEEEPLHVRLARIRESARRREEWIRQQMEWVETRRRELWGRLSRQPEPPAPAFAEPAPRLHPVEPARLALPVQTRDDDRRHEARAPALSPRPAEVLLAQFHDILLLANALIEVESVLSGRASDPLQPIVTEP